MLSQIMTTESFFRFTDVLVNGGIDHSRVLVDMARAIGGIAAFFFISKRIYEQLIADNPISLLPLLRPFALVLVITFWGPFVNLLMVPTRGLTKLSEAVYADKKNIVAQRLKINRTPYWPLTYPHFTRIRRRRQRFGTRGSIYF